VDDVGEGYAGLQRVMAIRPDVLKLDRALVTNVDREPAKAALVDAVVRYAARTGALVCAEGVETRSELSTLADLDVAQVQGFLVGRPTGHFAPSSEDALRLCRSSFARVLRADAGWAAEQWDIDPVLAGLADAPDLLALNRCLTGVAQLVRAELAAMALLTADGTTLRGILAGTDVASSDTFPVEDYPVTRRVLEHREAALIRTDDVAGAPDEVVVLRDLGFRAALLVPMTAGGRPVGVLQLYRQDDEPWTRAHIRVARTVAAVLGPAAAALRPPGF
jgi:GAF domain-containing protein